MWCCQCNKDLAACTCPDIEERLNAIKSAPHVATRWCDVCEKYADRCVCKDGPTTKIVTAGVEYKQPPLAEQWLKCPEPGCDAVWVSGYAGLRAMGDCHHDCAPVPTTDPNLEQP